MKKVIACVLFCAIVVWSLVQLTDFFTPKPPNRYYILEKYLEENPEQNCHDVQVFGSCHAYTSFNPIHLEEKTGVSAFVYANAGEIIPTTYLRMLDQFRKHTPKVALVEIWGINPYDTYDSVDNILGFYLANNLERLPFTREKLEVIEDFETVDFLPMNFPLASYKDRLTDGSLNPADFHYSFEKLEGLAPEYEYEEMQSRLTMNGFKKNPSIDRSDYPDIQTVLKDDGITEIDSVILKYLQKIIDLCKEKGVELIFYRTPYIARPSELQRLKHLQQICDKNGLQFIDLEAEIEYDYATDLKDYQHLSEVGANKSTEYLAPFILEALKGA